MSLPTTRGHGKTAQENKSLGVCEDGDPLSDNMNDQIMLTKFLKTKYNLPVLVFGHSYGSFITQSYLQVASDLPEAVILCGSAKQSGLLVKAGKAVGCLQSMLFDKNKPATFMTNMAFKPYDAKFSHDKMVNAWLSTDLAECEKYNNDPLCGFKMSIDFYKSLSCGFVKLYQEINLNKIRRDIPIYIISGDMDPVGGFGKLTTKLYDEYVKNGLQNVSLKLYKGARHEILNDTVRDEVMFDVLAFAEKVFSKVCDSKSAELEVASSEVIA